MAPSGHLDGVQIPHHLGEGVPDQQSLRVLDRQRVLPGMLEQRRSRRIGLCSAGDGGCLGLVRDGRLPLCRHVQGGGRREQSHQVCVLGHLRQGVTQAGLGARRRLDHRALSREGVVEAGDLRGQVVDPSLAGRLPR